MPPFGGVYQTCEVICENLVFWEECPPQDRCDQFIQRNTITGDFTCPVGHHPEPIVDFVYGEFEDRVVDQEIEDCVSFFILGKL